MVLVLLTKSVCVYACLSCQSSFFGVVPKEPKERQTRLCAVVGILSRLSKQSGGVQRVSLAAFFWDWHPKLSALAFALDLCGQCFVGGYPKIVFFFSDALQNYQTCRGNGAP